MQGVEGEKQYFGVLISGPSGAAMSLIRSCIP